VLGFQAQAAAGPNAPLAPTKNRRGPREHERSPLVRDQCRNGSRGLVGRHHPRPKPRPHPPRPSRSRPCRQVSTMPPLTPQDGYHPECWASHPHVISELIYATGRQPTALHLNQCTLCSNKSALPIFCRRITARRDLAVTFLYRGLTERTSLLEKSWGCAYVTQITAHDRMGGD
jgi:hypothetical protein